MTGYRQMLVAMIRPLPIPVSFLLDKNGKLSVIYEGRVSIDQVIADSRQNPDTFAQRWTHAACLPGSTIENDALWTSLRRWEANTHFAMAIAFEAKSSTEDAIRFYRNALKFEPDFALAKNGLARSLYNQGIVHAKQQRLELAQASYLEAIQLKKDYWQAHMNLAGILLNQKRFAEAAAEYRNVLKINPNFEPARATLKRIDSLLKNGQ